VGHPVRRLARIAIGPIKDQTLRSGQWRRLSNGEVLALYRATGLKASEAHNLPS
jgi:23S rRNA pseudouridine2605 synthase